MSDRIYYILIIIGVISLLGTIVKLITNLFSSKRKLEKQLDESLTKAENFKKSAEADITRIRNVLIETDNAYFETVKAMRSRICELTETLNDTYQVTCSLYDEHKILIEYAEICRKISIGGLDNELKKQLEHTIEKHNEFLNELNQEEIQEQSILVPEQSQGFEVAFQ